MGEAKRKKLAGPTVVSTVYHHTSVLRTNLIWMSGVIQVEGECGTVQHPQLGKIGADASLRRAMTDFPPVAWFTSRISVPRCLQDIDIKFASNADSSILGGTKVPRELVSAFSLDRLALGFPVQGSSIVPWSKHPGYLTPEGQELNKTAQEVGDNPDDWWVSEKPIDVLAATEVWMERRRGSGRLERYDPYLADIRRMVELCRSTPGAYIPPSWLTEEQARKLAARMGVEVAG